MSEVLLRDLGAADLPILFEHQRDPQATRMAAFAGRDRDAFMTHWGNVLADDAVTTQTVLVDGEVAGNVVSWGPPGERLVGYWIGRDHWGKGVATAALSAFLERERTRPLHAHVAKHNAGSIRVLEKCGFTLAGKQHVSDEAGDIDELVFVLETDVAPVERAVASDPDVPERP